jgi:hypothetical protein
MRPLTLPGRHSGPPLPADLSRVTAILLLLLTGTALAASYTPPDLEGFTLHHERDADGDGDGVDETRIRQYLSRTGDSIVSMSSGERLWAWSLDTRGDESGPRNYVIRDSDCDGVFDEVYGLDDEFHLPDCLK